MLLGGVALIVSVNESSRFYRKQNLSVTLNYHGLTFCCPAGRAMPPNVGGMKSCRLRAISYPVTQKLKRATTLE